MDLLKYYDQPFLDTSAFPTLQVFSEVSKSKKVVLTGDGADELFGGYKWYSKRFNSLAIWVDRLTNKSVTSMIRKLRIAKLTNSERKKMLLLHGHDFLEYYSQGVLALGNMEEISTIFERFEVERDYDPLWQFRKYWKRYTRDH